MKKDFRIGVIIDSFLKASFKEGLDEAVRVGAEGMQVFQPFVVTQVAMDL